MDNKSREAKQERLRQIAQMRRARGTESDRPTLPGEAARALGARPAAPLLPNLSDPALYLDFFGQTLGYATSLPPQVEAPIGVGLGYQLEDRGLGMDFWSGYGGRLASTVNPPLQD